MARPCSRAAALALLALAALLGVAAGQQAVPAAGSATPAGARDPANIFHWDTLSLGQAPAAATIPQVVITFPLAPAPAPVSYAESYAPAPVSHAETYASSRSSAAAAPSPDAPSPDAGADSASDESSDAQAAPAPAPVQAAAVVGTGQLPQRPGSPPQRPGPPRARPTSGIPPAASADVNRMQYVLAPLHALPMCVAALTPAKAAGAPAPRGMLSSVCAQSALLTARALLQSNDQGDAPNQERSRPAQPPRPPPRAVRRPQLAPPRPQASPAWSVSGGAAARALLPASPQPAWKLLQR
jgi:hypothetical protein